MVEENDQIPDDRKAAAEYAKMLQETVFPHLKVAPKRPDLHKSSAPASWEWAWRT